MVSFRTCAVYIYFLSVSIWRFVAQRSMRAGNIVNYDINVCMCVNKYTVVVGFSIRSIDFIFTS